MSGEATILPREELHVVSQGQEQVLFHIPTFNFFTINPTAAQFLRAYTSGLPLPDCRDKCGVSQPHTFYTGGSRHGSRTRRSERAERDGWGARRRGRQ